MNVGIYYMANACGRLAGTVLSGLLYQVGLKYGPHGGLTWCLVASTGFLLAAGFLSFRLPRLSKTPNPSILDVAVGGD